MMIYEFYQGMSTTLDSSFKVRWLESNHQTREIPTGELAGNCLESKQISKIQKGHLPSRGSKGITQSPTLRSGKLYCTLCLSCKRHFQKQTLNVSKCSSQGTVRLMGIRFYGIHMRWKRPIRK